MTPQAQLKRNLRTVAWTTGAICVAVSTLLGAILIYVRIDQAEIVERQLAHYNDKVALEQVMGYGGMIHSFKNWILRPEERRYRDAAKASADRALDLLGRIQAGTTVPDDPRFDGLRHTLEAYRDSVDTVSRMHALGHTAKEIDTAVRVDDADALEGLRRLHAILIEQMRSYEATLVKRRTFTFLIPMALIVFVSSMLTLLVRQRARLRREHDQVRIDDMEQFTQIAAHDLRGPLLQIGALLDFARDDLEDVPAAARAEIDEHLETISGRVAKLDAMVRAVFRYIRVVGAAQEREEIDLAALMRDVADLHLPVGASLCLDGAFPQITAQKVELAIVLRNLLSNAVKHHPNRSPKITVRHRRMRGAHHFEVEDDGKGIPPEVMDRVFDMFWSLNGHQNSDEVSGLGLALVRRIVTRWQGEVWARNSDRGGAILGFSLPTG
ncbi:HAMP domain-containing sensor histidine kinase [Sulfitobacter sp. D35]|uniref:sensor histidine kinase n=1 Tax=Sulfitobacter sp. D35 TaxID=3083252 RepID=UPI00296E5640|nr:HAMP domain-containing sensor histidine kinase [Sulfitobacter sp. D35]MDW4498263.1 HAMP domain-containing sensor histidine kinase [Sulfitobacter sp. D35]